MARYRRIPVIVEASTYHSGIEDGFCDDLKKTSSKTRNHYCWYPYIHTADGRKIIREDDFVIVSPPERRDVVSKEIFTQNYEDVQ